MNSLLAQLLPKLPHEHLQNEQQPVWINISTSPYIVHSATLTCNMALDKREDRKMVPKVSATSDEQLSWDSRTGNENLHTITHYSTYNASSHGSWIEWKNPSTPMRTCFAAKGHPNLRAGEVEEGLHEGEVTERGEGIHNLEQKDLRNQIVLVLRILQHIQLSWTHTPGTIICIYY